jgi:predicted ATP-dependent endonuclease of OLD family
MTTQTHKTEQDVVKNLRKIRDEISSEIKDMTFEQERAYLDKLLADKDKSAPNKGIAASGAGR